MFDDCYRIDPATGCCIWLHARKGKEVKKGGGYGCLRINGRLIGAHKFAYERAYGLVPGGLQVSHTCHNTLCVNPAHMVLETNHENQTRGASLGRKAQKLTIEAVRDIRIQVAAGVPQKTMAEKYRVGASAICAIIARREWKHVT